MQFWEEIEENDKFITKLNSNVFAIYLMLVIIDVIMHSCTHAPHKWFFVKENLNDIFYLDESDTPKLKK